MSIDRADWHYGGNFPKGLPPENGGTHIGMFLAWVILNGLESDEHREESKAQLEAVRARAITGRDFLFQVCDEKFWDGDLSDEGRAFAMSYYSGSDGYGQYLSDYEATLAGDVDSLYEVKDTWENYDKIAPFISRAFERWRATRS